MDLQQLANDAHAIQAGLVKAKKLSGDALVEALDELRYEADTLFHDIEDAHDEAEESAADEEE